MEKKYKIITDPKFNFLRVDPIPTAEEVDRYYKEEFYSSYKNFNDSELKVQLEEKNFFDSRWEAIYNRCLKYFGEIKGKSLFDVGFGYGQLLLFFKAKGFKVSGLEPSPEGVEYVRKHNIEVYQAGIEELPSISSNRFDVVTIINVLEHLRNPAETLIQIRKNLLNTNGLLVVDVANEFNDFQTVANQEYHLNDWWVCQPNHINYFSVTSLKNLIKSCDYDIVDYQSSFPIEIFMLMGDVYVGNPDLGKQCHQRRVKFEYLMNKHGKGEKLQQLYKHLADVNLGRQVVIYATPR